MNVYTNTNLSKKRKAILFGIAFLMCVIVIIGGLYLSDFIKERQIEMKKDALLERVNYQTELFGKQMYVFSPEDPVDQVQEILDDLWKKQETNQFGSERYVYFFCQAPMILTLM